MPMDIDYVAALNAIKELEEVLNNQEHMEREDIAEDIIEFVEKMKKKYKQ